MADAYVRLGLDPSGVVAGGRAAIAGLDPFVRRVQAMPAALRPVSGAVDGLTARYRTLGRAARGAFGEQIAAARRAGSTLQAEGRKAGAAFGTTLAAGIRSRSGAAASAAARVMSDIAAYLPAAGSGARRGPLANLTRSGRAIPEVLAVGVRSGTPTLRAAVAAMTAQARAQIAAGLRPPAGAGVPAALPAPSRGGAAPPAPYRGAATVGSGGQFEVLPVTRGGVAALPAPGRGAAVPLAGAAALPAPAGLGRAAPEVTNRAGIPVSPAPAQQAGVVQRAALPPPVEVAALHPARDRVAPGHPARDRRPWCSGGSTCASGVALHRRCAAIAGGSPSGPGAVARSRRQWAAPSIRPAIAAAAPASTGAAAALPPPAVACLAGCRDGAARSPAPPVASRSASWPPLPSRLPPDPCCAMPAPVS